MSVGAPLLMCAMCQATPTPLLHTLWYAISNIVMVTLVLLLQGDDWTGYCELWNQLSIQNEGIQDIEQTTIANIHH